jgi:hypothetical protein
MKKLYTESCMPSEPNNQYLKLVLMLHKRVTQVIKKNGTYRTYRNKPVTHLNVRSYVTHLSLTWNIKENDTKLNLLQLHQWRPTAQTPLS